MITIPELKLDYTIKITDTYDWQIVVNTEGVHFHDLSGLYWHPKGKFSPNH